MPIDSPAMPSTPTPLRRSSTAPQRGVILIFVVVFLVLLAIIGAAFVSASRIDRMQIGNLGGRNIERDPNIRDVYDQAVEAVLQKLEQDDPFSVDGFDDEFMSALMPRLLADPSATGTLDNHMAIWPKISQPVGDGFTEDFFIRSPKEFDPTGGFFEWGGNGSDLSDDGRRVAVGEARMLWFDQSGTVRKRIMPGLRPYEATSNVLLNRDVVTTLGISGHTGEYFAGDADGDGIADTGMSVFIADPSITAPGDVQRYVRNGIFYTVGYRVVDKNGQINVNTAGSRDGLMADINGDPLNFERLTDDPSSDFTTPDSFGPTAAVPQRYGLFRHEVGLIELFEFAGLNRTIYNTSAPDDDAALAAQREFYNLARSRFGLTNDENVVGSAATEPMTLGQLSAVPLDSYNNNWTGSPLFDAADPEGRTDYYLRGTGDLAEQYLARRILFPGVYFESSGWETNAGDEDQGTYGKPFADGDSDGLSFRGGLRPKYGDSAVSDNLKTSVDMPDINSSGGRGPLAVQPYTFQPYAALTLEDPEQRYIMRTQQANTVPMAPERLFDPNVFPANEHDVWSAGAKAMLDDPDYNTNAAVQGLKYAYTWRMTGNDTVGAMVGGNYNGNDPNGDSINGPGNDDFGYFRSIRPLLTTVNGISPGVSSLDLVTIPGGTANSAASYGPAGSVSQALARTYRLIEWTQDPVYLSNSAFATGANSVLPVAASGNTSSVRDLFRAYFHVLADPTQRLAHADADLPMPRGFDGVLDAGTGTDLLTGTESTYFRNVFRYNRTGVIEPGLSASQVMILRAAILAANTKDLRDADDDVSVFIVDLGPQAQDADGDTLYGEDGTGGGAAEAAPFETAAAENVTAVVYGLEKQPYITEVMVWNFAGVPGVAIEIFNPHAEDIVLDDWYLVGIDRDATVTAEERPIPATTPIFDLSGTTIPANTRIVVTSSAVDPAAPTAVEPFGATPTVIATLTDLINTEVTLMRPAFSAGLGVVTLAGEEQRTDEVASGLSSNQLGYNEGDTAALIRNLVPIDQVDLTGMDRPETRFYYARSTAPWEFVYPGRFATDDVPPAAAPNLGPDAVFVTEGPEYRSTFVDGIPQSDVIVQDLTNADYQDYGAPTYVSTYIPTFGIESLDVITIEETIVSPIPAVQVQNFRNDLLLGTTDAAVTAAERFFPFGMFARDTDLLQATMFGSYKLVVSPPIASILSEDPAVTAAAISGGASGGFTGRILEINSPTTDMALMMTPEPVAEVDIDGDGIASAGEVFGYPDNPGRFDFDSNNLNYVVDEVSKMLFDYIHAHQGTADDFLPMVRPEEWGPLMATLPAGDSPYDYTLAAGPTGTTNELGGSETQMPAAAWLFAPKPVDNDGSIRRATGLRDANIGQERLLPIQGRVNINTAPAEVLAMLPLVLNDDGTVNPLLTRQAAYNIANYRDGLRPAKYAGPGQFPTTNDPEFGGQFDTIFDLLDADDGASTVTLESDVADYDTAAKRENRGNFTPFDPNGTNESGLATDFEMKLGEVGRISNLITTRSDAYDVYIVVQSWRFGINPNTGNPDPDYTRLVDERRGQFRIGRDRLDGGFSTKQFAVPPRD